jgi:hypothetical protein
VYRFDGSNWGDERKLLPSDLPEENQFGFSVSVSGNEALVGAWLHDDNGTDSGSAYVFNLPAVGTCCLSSGSCDAAGNCLENITLAECQTLGGSFLGPDVSCAEACVNGECIPTVSTWGVVALTLLLLVASTTVLRRRVASG